MVGVTESGALWTHVVIKYLEQELLRPKYFVAHPGPSYSLHFISADVCR